MIIKQKENQEVEKRLVLEVIEKLQKDNTFEIWVEALADYLYDIIKETRQRINKNTNTASLRWKGVIEAIMKKIKETTNIYIDNPVLAVKIINNFINKYNLHIQFQLLIGKLRTFELGKAFEEGNVVSTPHW